MLEFTKTNGLNKLKIMLKRTNEMQKKKQKEKEKQTPK